MGQKLVLQRGSSTGSTDLLKTVLSTSNLPQVLMHMQPFALVRLVQGVGVEDCEEILEHLSPAQMAPIVDEELWRASRVGAEEKFDIKQAIRWLRVWNEMGPEHIIRIFSGMGRDFLATLMIHFADVQELSGVAWDMLNLDGFGSVLEEQDSPFRHVYSRFVLESRSKDAEEWELLVGVMDALWETSPDVLEDALSACCNRSHQDEVDEEGKGREKVNEVEDILRDNLSRAREDRRRRLGFLAPEQARDMLQRCRAGDALRALRDFLSERFLWSDIEDSADEEEDNSGNAASVGGQEEIPDEAADVLGRAEAPDVDEAVFGARALEMAVLAATSPARPLLALPSGADSGKERDLQTALRVAAQKGFNESKMQVELTGLANLVISGCNVVGRKFEETQAFSAVLSLVEMGLIRENGASPQLPLGGVLEAFVVGISMLQRRVALESAGALDDLVRSRHPDHAFLRQTFVEVCIRKEPNRTRFYLLVKEGRFFELSRLFSGVEKALPAPVSFAFRCLMSECPVVPQVIESGDFVTKSSKEWRHFSSENDFLMVKEFLAKLPSIL
jgi:hypothetical protein